MLSFWLPGLGQCLRCEWAKGAVFLTASSIASDRALANACSAGSSWGALVGWSVAVAVVWIAAVVDVRRSVAREPNPGSRT